MYDKSKKCLSISYIIKYFFYEFYSFSQKFFVVL